MRGTAVERERPVGLTKKMMQFLDAFVEADEHGAAVVLLVLDQRKTVVKTTRFGLVVVEQFVFPTGFFGHRTAKSGQFPRLQRRVELNG